jgi:replicative DNA helicase
MDGEDLVNRIMCSHTMQDMDDIHEGRVNWDLTMNAYGELAQYPVTLIETAATLRKLELSARRWKIANQEAIEKHGGMFIIDYFGIIRFDEKSDNETQAQGEIARRLKMLARELNVPIITALQLRKPPAGQKTGADNNDARGSGAILNEADKIIFIKPISEADDDADGKQDVDLVITKNRGGKTGRIHTVFDRKHSRFYEVEYHQLPEQQGATSYHTPFTPDRYGGNN